MIRNTMTFNGVDFATTYHAYVAQSNFLDGASKDIETFTVLGRSGDLQIDNHRFNNITLKVLVYITENMQTNMHNLRNYLASCKGYKRYTESLNSGEFRMASFKRAFVPDTYDTNGGTVLLEFDCMPQRFLIAGETPVSSQSQSHSYEGNPVSISNPSGLSSVSSLSVDLEPIQDTSGGDPSPTNICPITGHTEVNVVRTGKNLLPNQTVVKNGNNYFLCGGSSDYPIHLKAGTYTIQNKGVMAYCYGEKRGGSSFTIHNGATYTGTFTLTEEGDYKFWYYQLNVDETQFYENMLEIGSSASSYEPYTGTTYPVKFPSINAWDEEWEVGNYDENTGEPITSANSTQRNKNPIHVKPSTEYYFCCETTIATAPSVMVLEYDASGGFLGAFYKYAWTFSFTTKATTKTVNFRVYNTSMSALGDAGNLSFNYPSTYHTYIPYTTPQTVYGGTVDVVTGVLTVDRTSVTLDSSMTWQTVGSSGHGWQVLNSSLPANPKNTGANYADGVYCDRLKPLVGASTDADNLVFINSSGVIRVNTADIYADKSAMFTALGNIQVVYPLATPITYNLTPTQVSLLTGTNIITSDSGDMTITVTEPSLLVNPTLFESKPLLRIYGTGTVNINDQYITISAHSFPYIDIDCELMDAYYGSSNANQYVTFSTNDYIVLKPGTNYIAYGNTLEVTPRWFEI